MYVPSLSPAGPEFAERIKQNEAGNAKFNFLTPSDPYHAYYLHKINEIQEAVLAPQQAVSGRTHSHAHELKVVLPHVC